MAHVPILSTEVDTNSPMDTNLWDKVKGNDDDHETRILAVEGGAGGGAALELLEQKSHLEKSGIKLPLSIDTGLNESFTDPTNLTWTLAQDYSTADTTAIKLDLDQTLIDDMEATTGWTATNGGTVSLDSTNFLEGSNSVKIVHTLTGATGIQKTFTAFNLGLRNFRARVYLDTITNVTKVTITLESSSGNDVSFDTLVADLAATTWNFLHADIDNPDASTGTFDRSAVTKILIEFTTSSSQTINMSTDYLVDVDNKEPLLPLTQQIYDTSNEQLLVLVSGSNGAYVLVATLANDYTIPLSVVTQRNLTIQSQQGKIKTGLSGDVAKNSYDITRQYFPSESTTKGVAWSQRFLEESFLVEDFPTTTTLDLTSVTDRSASFKSGDHVWIFKKVWGGRHYESSYNSTYGANAKRLTLSIDSTWSSGTLTLTHTESNANGSDTDDWYVIRESVLFYFWVGDKTANESLAEDTPNQLLVFDDAIPYNTGILSHWKLDESSGTALDALGVNDAVEVGVVDAAEGKLDGARAGFTASKYFWINSGGSSSTQFDISVFAVEGWYKMTTAPSATSTIVGKSNSVPSAGWTLYLNASGFLTFLMTGGATTQESVNTGDNNWHYFFAANIATSGSQNCRLYRNGALVASQNGRTLTPTAQSFSIGVRVDLTLVPFVNGIIDDLVFWSTPPTTWAEVEDYVTRRYNNGNGRRYSNEPGYIFRGETAAQTGNKLVTATKLTRQDTTNQDPLIFQRDTLILG